MERLDVINDMLSTLGETPVAQLDEDHPFIAAGNQILKTVDNREQAKGWWFNKEVVTLSPDATTKEIFVPADALSVNPPRGYSHFAQRGRRLYNNYTQSYHFDSPMVCEIIRKVPFEELPPTAAAYIAASAVLQFQRNYDADQVKTRELKAERGEAYYAFHAEHIRNSRANLMLSRSMQLQLHALGDTPQLGPVYLTPN